MPDSASHRWRHFSMDEKRLIQAALADMCEQIADAVQPGVPEFALREGALAFLTAHEVLFSIDDHLGRPHPPDGVVAQVAAAIMEGDHELLSAARRDALGEAEAA
jgi:hypothetical protein